MLTDYSLETMVSSMTTPTNGRAERLRDLVVEALASLGGCGTTAEIARRVAATSGPVETKAVQHELGVLHAEGVLAAPEDLDGIWIELPDATNAFRTGVVVGNYHQRLAEERGRARALREELAGARGRADHILEWVARWRAGTQDASTAMAEIERAATNIARPRGQN